MFSQYFFGFILPILINILFIVFLVTCTEYKAYIVHILIAISTVIPICNWIVAIIIFIWSLVAILEDNYWVKTKLKSNKLTKFLFNKQN